MNYETLLLDTKDNIATITLTRPDKLNALSLQSVIDLRAALKQVVASSEVRALVLTGAGRGFSTGADLTAPKPRLNLNDRDELLRDYFTPVYHLLKDLRIPTVAAVNGPCAGAGMSLALTCDIVLAARSAYFIQAFVNVGLVPDTGSSWLVTQALGDARATALMLLGEKLPAETAAQWGLIWKCVDDDKLLQETGVIAAKLASGPTVTYSLTKRLVREAKNNSLRDQILLENECQAMVRDTYDAQEARKAFAEKRKPVFKGR